MSDFYAFMLYDSIEPFGDRRGDIQAGMIQKTLADIHRDPKQKPYPLEMFMPQFYEEPARQQTPEEQLQILLALQAAQKAGEPN